MNFLIILSEEKYMGIDAIGEFAVMAQMGNILLQRVSVRLIMHTKAIYDMGRCWTWEDAERVSYAP